MTEISLGCSACKEHLTVTVEDDSGPWSVGDADTLHRTAEKAGWLAYIKFGDMAFVYCPDHIAEGRLVRSAL